MVYKKPSMSKVCFSVYENIMEDTTSAITTDTTTTNPDDINDPDYEIVPTNAFNMGQ